MQNPSPFLPRLVLAVLPLISQAASTAELTLGAGLRLFNYEEFSTAGTPLNKESGFLPGIGTAIQLNAVGLVHSLGLDYWGGRVDYKGKTQSGQPHTTKTDETMLQLQYRAGWRPAGSGNGTYAAAAWNRWDRDILPANGVSGLFERYEWWTLKAGIEGELLRRAAYHLAFEIGILVTRSGTIQIDLTQAGFGNNTLNLGDGQGFNGVLDYAIDLAHENRLRFRLEHIRWTFRRSDTIAVSNGASTIFIAEPDSESNHTSLRVEYVYDF